MKTNIYPLISPLHKNNIKDEDICKILKETFTNTDIDYRLVDVEELYDCDLPLIMVLSGGSEQYFLEKLNQLKEPYYILTTGNNNSLAASLEILSFIKDKKYSGEVLHGSTNYIVNRIIELNKKNQTTLPKYRYGVIGKPSDWLIASKVDYSIAKDCHNIELIDIAIEELIDLYNQDKTIYKNSDLDFDVKELSSALKLDNSIKSIKNKYNLNGLTIRCFDLLDSIKTTACLSLSLLNSNNVVSTCEGDIPTMISMHILNTLTSQPGFQVNPSKIDVETGKIVFAHCTLPLNMNVSYTLDTHFESGIGVAIRGKLKEEQITIFKLSNDLKNYFITTGRIIRNLDESNLCRTQIEVKLDSNIEYFLNRPYGNHHVIIYGDYKSLIETYMKNIN